jgi:sugar/nucleoside kinase (ribokinase family)
VKKIIGIGNALVDVLARIDSDKPLKELGLPIGSMQFISVEQQKEVEMVLASLDTNIAAGGSTSNTMRGAAMLGMETAFIGKIGSDELGEKLRAALKVQHVRPLLVMQEGMPTGIASAFITPDGQRTFADNLGASALLSPTDFQSDILNGYDTLFMEGYMVQNHDLITTVLSWAKERDMTTCIDLASYNVVSQEREFFHNLIERYIDIVFANEDESTALTGKNAENAAREMSQICQLAVVKMGSRGACAFVDGQLFTSPGVHVDNVIDTTGAGDSFAAAFLYALSQGQDIETCLATGNTVAAEMIQHIGATMHEAIWKDIKSRIQF